MTQSSHLRGYLLCAALAALAALTACAAKPRPQVTPTVPVTVATVAQKDVPLQLTSIGTVEAYNSVQIKSLVAGQIVSVHFTLGQDVKKGDLLFTIDRRPFEADLQRALATLAKDQAQSVNARAQAARWSQLQKEGVVAREQAEQIITNALAQEAVVNADKAAVEESRLQLQYTTIYAPIAGRTGDLMVHAGNLVKANDVPALVTINQVTPIYVDFAVPERSLADVKRYMAQGKLAVDAAIPGQPAPAGGVLTFVDNNVDTATGTLKLKATFENADRKLWPGQFVNTTLTLTTESSVTVVSSQALQSGPTGSFVYIVKDDRTTERRDVVVERQLASDVVVKTGLKPGEMVITDGQLLIVPGPGTPDRPASKVDFKNAGGGPPSSNNAVIGAPHASQRASKASTSGAAATAEAAGAEPPARQERAK